MCRPGESSLRAPKTWNLASSGSGAAGEGSEIEGYGHLRFTDTFVESLVRLSASDRRRVYKALELLNSNEPHPSLRVHELTGDLVGIWSASASDVLRIEFIRAAAGMKVLLRCSRHYAR